MIYQTLEFITFVLYGFILFISLIIYKIIEGGSRRNITN